MTPSPKPRQRAKSAGRPGQHAVAPAAPGLTPEETKFVEDSERDRGISPPPFTEKKTPTGPVARPDDAVDQRLWFALLGKATGSKQPLAQLKLAEQLRAVYATNSRSPAADLEAALAHVIDIGPKDGLEGMLAVQMVSVHKVAMDLVACGAKNGQSIELAEFYLRNGARLVRLFGAQIEALGRLRGKSPVEQKVTVQHVTVQGGGQAIVGNVAPASRMSSDQGGGGEEEKA